MQLREIKPGMVIHCKNDAEKKALLEEAERLGYVWYGTEKNPTEKPIESTGNTIYFYDADKSCLSGDYKHITHSINIVSNAIEFSDLILPELTAEEVLNTIKEICASSNACNDMCLLCDGKGCVIRKTEFDVKKVIEICAKWKSNQEKKEPEIETVDICRIIEIQPDGRKRCVHEEDIKKDTELPYGSEEIAVHEILKRYCMEHDGEFIAVHEVVSRVKEVK